MLFLSRSMNWNTQDYRDYCDHRARLKRRLRLGLRMSIGLTLMGCMLAIAAWAPNVSV